MKKATLFIAISVFATTHALNAGEDASKIVGLNACKMCHKSDEKGNQFKKWQESPHAKAYAVLASEEGKAAAAKAGVDDPQKSPKCLSCHSTAYFNTESVQTDKVAVEEGVVCESCHGAGKDYKKTSAMKNRAEAMAAGMIYPATQSCTKCHNEKSPSWKPDRYTTADGKKVGFDAEQAYKKVEHPNPQAKP